MKLKRQAAVSKVQRGAVSRRKKNNIKTKLMFLLKFIGAGVIGAGLFVLAGAANNKSWDFSYENPVENILVEGAFENVSKEDAVTVISGEIKDDFLQVNLGELRDILEAMPWVERAIVRRQWPNALVVKIIEQKPIARWGAQGFLNQRGEVVHTQQREKLMSLPWLFGRDEDSARIMLQYQNLSLLLRSRGLLVSKLWIDEKSTWRVTLDNDVDIVIGRDEISLKIRRFIRVYDEYLVVNMNAIKTIDLRYENGLAVAWADGYNVKIESAS